MSSAETAQNLREFHSNFIDSVLELWYNKSALSIAQKDETYCCPTALREEA